MAPKPIEKNTLFYGDNLQILREYVADESVDLIYLDPPFNSNRSYNVLFKDESGAESDAQMLAFEDTWHWGPMAEATYTELVQDAPQRVSTAISAMRQLLGTNQVMAYLTMMAARLLQLHRVLKATGSIYLHCDPTASHYLKLIMDAIFGAENFRSEIIWKRTSTHSDAKRWSPVSDTIFYYSKTGTFTWNQPYTDHDESYLKGKYRFDDNDGRGPYRLSDMTSPNPRPNLTYEWMGYKSPTNGWRYSRETMRELHEDQRIAYPDSKDKRPQLKRYLREMPGRIVDNVWTDINPVNPQARERLDYPTQKPVQLLERIIAASSNPGDIVLDPFCGCGTAIHAAQKLGRRWVGIDITHLSIGLQKYRLRDAFELEPKRDYEVIGEPQDLSGAEELAGQDRYQFQWWALSLVQARPQGGGPGDKTGKKGADKGIDGVISFVDGKERKAQRVIVQVKSGKVSSATVRDLVGTLQREEGAIGVLITLEAATRDMVSEAASAGLYESPLWKNAKDGSQRFPKVQILTIEELLAGKRIEMPAQFGTFKQAGREEEVSGEQGRLL